MTKNEVLDKLQYVVSKEPSNWQKDAEFRFQNKTWLKRSQKVAIKILRTLRAQGLSQKDLADKLGVSAQLVNKWVKGKENFTFETIDKLERALNIELISVLACESEIKSEIQTLKIPYHTKPINNRTKMTPIYSECTLIQFPQNYYKEIDLWQKNPSALG